LLPYLVRRLLENGANTSFVNRIVDEAVPVAEIIADPVDHLKALAVIPHPRIPLPADLYGGERCNSRGLNLHDRTQLDSLAREMAATFTVPWHARPLVAGAALGGAAREIRDPACRERIVGMVEEADEALVEQALAVALEAFPQWCATTAEQRAACLEKSADLLEDHGAALMALCVREGGRTVPDAAAELREAVDYCRYYAVLARRQFARPQHLAGPAGEDNSLVLRGRGVFACISPWNFPLAIFTGQVAAALAAGNTVLAKPAHQTPLVAARAVALFQEAGVPGEVLQLLPGSGASVGAKLVADARLAGIAFTGSTETAWRINRALAARDAPIAALVAETGGQNCMIVDSSAFPEQVVTDVLQSAFNSAGQRCSALRVLFLQDEIAPRVLALLRGALAELRVGDPALLASDVGPLIDEQACRALHDHAARMMREGRLIGQASLPEAAAQGCFFAPRAYEIDSLGLLRGEVFGPILHVIRYGAGHLDAVIDAVNGTGYGLTLGVHSRIDETARHIRARVRAG
ncbi:MAG: bifunctional proline dehydrogenase/L-glutamate gamma-semialdehyde dehydrogenase PutA, partial [Gammaproteobacteria bacterium]